MFESIQAEQKTQRLSLSPDPIKVTLPDGTVKDAAKWQTTPFDVAKEISKNLANNALIARVNGVLWDMARPLEQDCELRIYKFEDDEGRDTFWHSSAHILGQSLEMGYGCMLCIGPCTTRGEGFYYDGFYGDLGLNDDHCKQIEAGALKAAGPCLVFKHRARGALSGLTRVRRFRQDDAHIFCRESQIKDEVREALKFIDYVYEIFGFTYDLKLSTRPENSLGETATWEKAESALKEALDEFGKPWQLNEGDGAFYGPKIDINVSDSLSRKFQCATLQLDFQLPNFFKLEYLAEDEAKIERPVVMIHRAILGSVERMFAILLMHYMGKWPFWLSPCQAIVCPVSKKSQAYAEKVKDEIYSKGFHVDADLTDRKIGKKVREAQLAQYNYILVVGEQEAETGQVSVRIRDKADLTTMSIEGLLERFSEDAKISFETFVKFPLKLP
ncbi:hypothetical protein Ahy_B05g073922 isoform E [Arachis hypogaea]|uniref:threonine--tRNA ligase n=1 Tax=Arachis hypogaea TaxID=3818 RepID=A0A444YXE3_ARAHY|nr:hypothetical protein Ahy_B05g073922 isoform E [Arachis hypogaea]